MRHFSDLAAVRSACEGNREQLVVYNGWVLNVRDFSHPGPQQLVLSNVGNDVTELFDDRGHSLHARELCERMAIGCIGGSASKAGQLVGPDRDGMSAEEEAIHKTLDRCIDITKPLVPQVKLLSNREFVAFVRRPRYVEDTDCIILHPDEATDRTARSDIFINLRLVIPAVIAEVLVAATWYWQVDDQRNARFPAMQLFAQFFLWFFVFGIGLMWTLTEYYFHAIVLHDEIRLDPHAPADGEKNASLFARHLHHHVFMNQKYRVVLHLKTYGTYVPLGFGLVFVLSKLNVLSGHCGLFAHAGWLCGSLLYDCMHYSFHHGPDIKLSWYQKMKAQHMRHHFRDNTLEFGVTNPWWDVVCGTSRESPKQATHKAV